MREPEKYWAYAQPPIPEVSDLPPGVFNGDEKSWCSLSPGMRRTIWREATKRIEREQSVLAEDAERLSRADTMHRQSEVQIAAREAL
jgi:predicted Fe-S protein YdhL (DUF1289 family)